MKYTVKELAAKIDGQVIGDDKAVIEETRGLTQATAHSISFAVGEFLDHLAEVKTAGAVVVEKAVPEAAVTQIVVENAKAAFAQILELFHPPVAFPKGIHETAIIGKNVTMGKNVTVGPYCVIYDNAVIGDNVTLHAYVYVGHNVQIGDDSTLYAGAIVHQNCRLGKRVVLRAKAVIGGEGFGFATEHGEHTHIPQVGNVVLEDDVEVGSCSCIDSAMMGSTLVRRGTKIDNLVQLGHNVEIGEDCFLISQVGIAGSTKCGNHVIFAGQTGCAGHVEIGDNVTFAGKTGITGNVPSNTVYAGYPMRPHKEWLKLSAYETRLPDMAKTIRRLEKQVAALQAQLDKMADK